MDVETAIYCLHHWDIDSAHHGRCLLCGAERDFSPIPDPHGRDRLRKEDYEAMKAAKEEARKKMKLGSAVLGESAIQDIPVVTSTPPINELSAETRKAVIEMAEKAAETLVPPKPRGRGLVVARYYDKNRAAIEADAKNLGVIKTRRKWGITIKTWNVLQGRWAGMQVLPQQAPKQPEQEQKVLPRTEIVGFNIEMAVGPDGRIKLIYTRGITNNHCPPVEREWLVELINLMIKGEST